jgi:hypothetical protein
VSVTPGSQLYCATTNQVLLIDGTGVESLQVCDYTLTLTGAGCSALHATTLVTRVSSTQLAVVDDLTGCTGDIFAQLTYQHQAPLEKVKIAALNDECANEECTAVYCPGAAQTSYIKGSGFNSLDIFDYTLTLSGSSCSALHATTLVTRVSETLLSVVEDLSGCDGDIYAVLKHQNRVPVVTKIASLSNDCGDEIVGNHNDFNSDLSGASDKTVSAVGVISFITLLLTVLLAYQSAVNLFASVCALSVIYFEQCLVILVPYLSAYCS